MRLHLTIANVGTLRAAEVATQAARTVTEAHAERVGPGWQVHAFCTLADSRTAKRRVADALFVDEVVREAVPAPVVFHAADHAGVAA